MPILVMKFGGTSLASIELIKKAAERVKVEVSRGYEVIAVSYTHLTLPTKA